MSTRIAPTIGRVVLYRAGLDATTQAAIVACVNGDDTVNLAIFYDNGTSFNAVQVPMVQDGDATPSAGHYCQWMPYQLNQAAKTEPAPVVDAPAVAPMPEPIASEPAAEPAAT